jgi:coenzyme PQQ synthesis protein D (PqqD)
MRYSIPESVLYQELPGEAVVLNLATAEYFHLNDLGRATLELIRAGADRRSLEDTLTREYDATPEQIHLDLEAFFKRMTELKLVTMSEA